MSNVPAEWISIREAAALLCANDDTVRSYIKRGVLTVKRSYTPRLRVRVLRSDVEAALRRRPGEPSRAEWVEQVRQEV